MGRDTGGCVVSVNWNSFNGKWNVNAWNRNDNAWNQGNRVFSPETIGFLPLRREFCFAALCASRRFPFPLCRGPPIFDKTWIADSYSCRRGKGTHRAAARYRLFEVQVSRNHTRTCWVLQCDIKKFFASIDQEILLRLVRERIEDVRVHELLAQIVGSFSSTASGQGLPLGNLTSQLLVNVYMNEFDQFVKHGLKCTKYVRYADDFAILSEDRAQLRALVPRITKFLGGRLQLSMHPKKVRIRAAAAGVDFLGWVHFNDHRILRPATKRRMLRNLAGSENPARLVSYLGLLSHGNAGKLARRIAPSI